AREIVGRRVEVLCEGRSKTRAERFTGRTSTNKVVIFDGEDRLIGHLLEVDIEETTGFTLYGSSAVMDRSRAVTGRRTTEVPAHAISA
ncbi:MAG: TRAM domain-containing protein, partial [Verrucomicrobiia bacterium]